MTETQISTVNTEADNIISAVQEDAFEKLLKFNKGKYLIGDEVVPLGTEYFAHAAAWTKMWIKFVDGQKPDRKLYRVARGEKAPEREELDDLELIGQKDADGKSSDPWVFQYLLPLENISNGEVVIFVTASIGGQKAVRTLCDTYARRLKKGQYGQPIVQLAADEMPTKNFGKVPCPLFEIVGWDDTGKDSLVAAEVAATVPVKPTKKVAAKKQHDDMDDAIPY